MRSAYRKYIFMTNIEGSKKASSYIRALDMLGDILHQSSGPFTHVKSIWDKPSIQLIVSLYHYIREEQRTGGIFQTKHAKSYWKNKYYSAALRSYISFLVELQYEEKLLNTYDSDDFKPEKFEFDIQDEELLKNAGSAEEGRDIIREVKTRAKQNVFRKKILSIYHEECCITGLHIPELNNASHIIPWSERKETRLDPRNGLCLSGTYDKAFDQHLISVDEDFRVILSTEIREYFTTDIAKRYFQQIEGQKIRLPKHFPPKQDYLAKHRSNIR